MVEGGGFEPPKVEPADLQSAPFDRSGTPPKILSCLSHQHLSRRDSGFLEPAKGLEPPTG
jgi:hypothetical protein